MSNILLAIVLWTIKTLFSRGLKIMVMLLVTTVSSSVLAKNKITGMRVGMVQIEERTGFRLVVETQSPLKASLLLLQSPYRLVIDMPETNWAVDELPPRGQLLVKPGTAYRFGTPRPNIGRLVLELEKPAAPVRVFSLPPSDGGNRFVIDLLDRGKTCVAMEQKAQAAKEDKTSKASQNKPKQAKTSKRKQKQAIEPARV